MKNEVKKLRVGGLLKIGFLEKRKKKVDWKGIGRVEDNEIVLGKLIIKKKRILKGKRRKWNKVL